MGKTMQNAACDGPAYDDWGRLSEACRHCGKCNGLAKLLRELAPAVANNKTTRSAASAGRQVGGTF
jgi:hypothetical protein